MVRTRIAVTMGDPAGVGPELCLKLLAESATSAQYAPVVFGDLGVLQRVARRLHLPLPSQILTRDEWPTAASTLDEPAILDFQCDGLTDLVPGVVSAATGRASYQFINASIEAALSGQVDAVATGPIHKAALRSAGVHYPGHTEIFIAQTNATRACMMLTCDEITCSFVTTHVGYRDVPELLSVERIVEVIELSHEAMTRIRGRTPRIVVCGLNPHGGEGGLFGDREEERIIAPAVQKAADLGIDIIGPLPPDTAFLRERRAETDCFVCMYHDQGHIPLKALAFDVAVNTTLGLPIIRTSVDHGTALDIAWQGKAGVTSLTEAVRLAKQLVGTQIDV